MHIDHVALWTQNLEGLKRFYEIYFEAHAGGKYLNVSKQFESYFLTFASGARLELMQSPTVSETRGDASQQRSGFVHIALSVGSRERVDSLTARLREDNYRVIDGPRQTGDGYYESTILDPDGNRVEITV